MINMFSTEQAKVHLGIKEIVLVGSSLVQKRLTYAYNGCTSSSLRLLRIDLYKGIVERSSLRFMLLVCNEIIYK